MHYYLADRQVSAKEPGARALLLDEDGLVTETSSANVLVFEPSRGLISPPLEKVLHGISLAVVEELARGQGVRTVYEDLSPEEASVAEEVMLASTPWCLLPVVRLDGRPIGSGGPGAMFGRLLEAWSELVGLDIAGQAGRFAGRGSEGS
jgi:branched-subunit amino acid aminotransferase/4-amino-4-deoxychorismate lyase